MKLFKYEGYNLTISEEAMMLIPFKTLWRRDKDRNKETAKMELGYIYFMEDPRSDYQIYVDRKERDKQIRIGEGIPEKWKPDKHVEEAAKFYAGFKSAAALLLDDLRVSVDTIRKGLISPEDMTDMDIDKRIKALDAYSNTVNKLLGLTIKLDETEKQLAKEITQNEKIRGSQEKSMFEDV